MMRDSRRGVFLSFSLVVYCVQGENEIEEGKRERTLTGVFFWSFYL